jgi:hypothetical protein
MILNYDEPWDTNKNNLYEVKYFTKTCASPNTEGISSPAYHCLNYNYIKLQDKW